jgi:regulator of nonsense transcripts 2
MKTQQAAEREEQQRIKNLVLNYDLREGDDLDGDSLLTPLPLRNTHKFNAGLEKGSGANYPRPDKSSNTRSGQRARKLQLSDVDWYDPEEEPHPLSFRRIEHSALSERNHGLSSSLKQRPDQAVNFGRGFSATTPRQSPQSSETLPRTNGKGRLTRREILQEHASRRAARAGSEK